MKKLTASKQKTQSKVEDVDDASNVMLVETNSLSRSSNDRLKNVAVVHI